MDAQVVVALISAAAAIFVSALTYFFSRKKDRDADWRKYKFERYHDFVSALSGMADPNKTIEAQRRYCEACNRLYLIAAAPVVEALHKYQAEIVRSPASTERQEALLSELFAKIRTDLAVPNADKASGFSAKLWYVTPSPRG